MKPAKNSLVFGLLLAVAFWLAPAGTARAQWQSQSFTLKPGWNAVYFHVDASYDLLDTLVGADGGNPITEIWMWQPQYSTLQFTDQPPDPTAGVSQWKKWDRSNSGTDTLTRVFGNSACLVRNGGAVDYVWTVKGRPVPPAYTWTTTGLNFYDFPAPPGATNTFATFLSLAPEFKAIAEFYSYSGGELGSNNPARLMISVRDANIVTRGKAFWLRAGNYYNTYFGPFTVALQDGDGVDFGAERSSYRLRLRNPTATTTQVRMTLVASETAPPGQTNVLGLPSVIVRGAFIASNLTYSALPVTGATNSWVLGPVGATNSEIEVILGVNRSAMAGLPDGKYAGILRFTDTNGFTQLDIPVSAQPGNTLGLWVGEASVNSVNNYLKTYARDTNDNPIIVPSSNGAPYQVTAVNNNPGNVAREFPLRLILHRSANYITLLQRVYFGQRYGTNLVIATRQSLLDAGSLASARRISAPHLPWSAANEPWIATPNQFGQGTTNTFVVPLSFDDQAANPFLHTYHPDHDNLDVSFRNRADRGDESYDVTRAITLEFTAPNPNDFSSLTTAGQVLAGRYAEAITFGGKGSESRTFNTSGTFSLKRISSLPVLTTAP